MKRIRVLVVDDSALVRSILSKIINQQKDMECIGSANDPLVAREMIRELNPDVITLDVEMPRMDGIDFLERLMRLRPMPVVMISTLTERSASVTIRALELGAVDFVAKPRLGVASGLMELSAQIVEKVRIAGSVVIRRAAARPKITDRLAESTEPVLRLNSCKEHRHAKKLICIGASTGGTEAIKEILVRLPTDSPGVVVTQHMPAGFTSSFAIRLNSLCQITVKEAVNGEKILLGHAYIAPGGMHLRVSKNGCHYIAEVVDGELVNRHKPSVEVLFKSVARVAGKNAYGIMLTGMGSDGAVAMREMKDAGSYNFVQNEASCVVFGMPKEAILQGAADEVLDIAEIAPALLARLRCLDDHVVA